MPTGRGRGGRPISRLLPRRKKPISEWRKIPSWLSSGNNGNIDRSSNSNDVRMVTPRVVPGADWSSDCGETDRGLETG